MGAARTSVLHTREQGKRVHVLANLGGLTAIAGLEHVEPDLLLGVLLEVGDRLPRMKPDRVEAMRQRGAAKLDERGTSKRAWSAHKTARELHNVHLTSDQIRWLLRRLGAPTPAHPDELASALSDAVMEA
ncbi:MAG: conjugal transfer protein TraD [bacterium]|nr:conjugal transfer protein TraD [bacterium]